MSSFKVAIMTDVGAKLMADSIIEGYKIEFVKMVIGSGEYEEEEKTAEALRIRTELKQKRQEVGFSSRLISDENEVLLKTLITNKELDVGYRMREIGIIAKKLEMRKRYYIPLRLQKRLIIYLQRIILLKLYRNIILR